MALRRLGEDRTRPWRLRGAARTRLLSSRLFRSPGRRAAKCRRGDLSMTSRASRDDGDRDWDSGINSEESGPSQLSGNPASKANMSLGINRYKKGRHHPGFEAPTRSQTFTTSASTRQATRGRPLTYVDWGLYSVSGGPLSVFRPPPPALLSLGLPGRGLLLAAQVGVR